MTEINYFIQDEVSVPYGQLAVSGSVLVKETKVYWQKHLMGS